MAGMMGYGMMGYGMGLGWLFSLLILAAFLLIVWWMLRGHGLGKESAKDILDKRLARGEITDKEYRKLRKEIGGGNGA